MWTIAIDYDFLLTCIFHGVIVMIDTSGSHSCVMRAHTHNTATQALRQGFKVGIKMGFMLKVRVRVGVGG